MIKNLAISPLFALMLFTQFAFGQGASANVYFDIRNEQVIGNRYHFDVFMRCDVPTTYLARGMVYILYDTTTFGSSVVNNGKATLSHLELLNDSISIAPGFKIPKYETFSVTDNGSRIVMVWHSPYYVTLQPPSPGLFSFWFTQVPDTFMSLYHVSIELKVPAGNANLALDLGLMFSPPPSQQFFFNPNATAGDRLNWVLPYGSGVLPATLASFSGQQSGPASADLYWSSQREYNNAYFQVEKSLGNEDDFHPIGRVEGAGDSDQYLNYKFVDESPMAEVNYYRLRQVNFNGDIAYSETIEVRMSLPEDGPQVRVYPNPATQMVTLETGRAFESPVRYTLSDLTGKALMQGFLNEKNQSQQLHLDGLAKGMYLVEFQSSSGKSEITRLVIK